MIPLPKRPALLYALLAVLLFIGIGGLYGGTSFLLAPDGSLLGMTTECLARAPVRDFTWPGLFLLLVMGVAPLVLAAALWSPHWLRYPTVERLTGEATAWVGVAAFDLLLLGWLGYQALILGFEAPVQWIVLATALAIAALVLEPGIRRHFHTPQRETVRGS